MRTKFIVTSLLISLSLVGCSNTDGATKNQQDEIDRLTEEVIELKEVIANQGSNTNETEEFTYLREFTEEDMASYQLFLEDYDVTHLSGFTPENILLLYFHSIAISDIDMTYAIAYDGGTLPEIETFKERFYAQGNSQEQHDAVIQYKDYDTVKVLDINKTEDSQTVEITASIGTHGSSNLYEVEKEDGQWKMSIQHWLEDR